MTVKRKLIFVLVFVLVGFVIFRISERNKKNIVQRANEEYPILGLSDSILGRIESIYNPPKLRSSPSYVRISFQEDFKQTIDVNGYALDNAEVSLRDVSMNGALLKKEANSDTIEVAIRNKTYKFLIDRND